MARIVLLLEAARLLIYIYIASDYADHVSNSVCPFIPHDTDLKRAGHLLYIYIIPLSTIDII